MLFGKTIESELVKFEPEAMRAFVKYKLLKKLIAQCIDRRETKRDDSKEDSPIAVPTEKELKEDAKAMADFVEDLIEDVIAANQYYNKKFGWITSEYCELYSTVNNDLTKKFSIFSRNRRDPTMIHRIFILMGEMLLLQFFGATNYSGIRKIIKKYRKVTKSSAVDGVMNILNNCPFWDITTQNEMISQIQDLYFLRLYDDSKRTRWGCGTTRSESVAQMIDMAKQSMQMDDITELRESSINAVIQRNIATPGKESLRDMVFRGHRVLKSRIPRRMHSGGKGSTNHQMPVSDEQDEIVADSMLIQMAFFAIPAEMFENGEGEILDSSEYIIWEGYMMRRFSALNQWKKRYIIVSNKRMCFFDTQYGALKKSLLFPDVISLYSGQTYRYPSCILLITIDNDAFWFANPDMTEFTEFFDTMKDLFSHLVLNFFGADRAHKSVNRIPSFTDGSPLYRSVGSSTLAKNRGNSTYTGSMSNRHPTSYASITNLFNVTPNEDERPFTPPLGHASSYRVGGSAPPPALKEFMTAAPEAGVKEEEEVEVSKEVKKDDNDEGKEIALAVEDLSSLGYHDVWLQKLENQAKAMKANTAEIKRMVYSAGSSLDLWDTLQRFDDFVNSDTSSKNIEPVHEEGEADQSIKTREISKIIECFQESQATNASIWSAVLMLYAICILKWRYPDLSALLRGKRVIIDTDILPTPVNINKLYRYERQIGEGKYSSVWIVESKRQHRFYALKKVTGYTLSSYERTALSREVNNMMILRGQDSIVKFFGFFKDDSFIYIVMELAPGGRLFDYIKQRQQFTESDAQKIVRCILLSIQYCHQNGVVHRDLKPQNILLMNGDDMSSMKLTDFGFSASVESVNHLKTSLGTPGYTAPEVLRHQEYDVSVDMWSIGVITYILLCGYPPFPSNNDAERLRAICSGQFQFYPQEWNSVSDDAKDFIRKLIVVTPKNRLTATEALQHDWIVKSSVSDVNLSGVISGITHIQKRFALQFSSLSTANVSTEVRTHICRSQVKLPVFTKCDMTSSVVYSFSEDYPLEIGAEVWNNGTQYGYLTDYCRNYYHIAEEGVCVAIQKEDVMYCIHALTYMYRNVTNKTIKIFSSPLDTEDIIGEFKQKTLICDTVLNINGVLWGIMHHMMYRSLKLSGIPQAWVILEDEHERFFEKQKEKCEEFVSRLKAFQNRS